MITTIVPFYDDEDADRGVDVVASFYPVWWDTADRIVIWLDGRLRVEAAPDDVEFLIWGISVTSGSAWPWHMVRAIHVRN
jgi:hypothetical protein